MVSVAEIKTKAGDWMRALNRKELADYSERVGLRIRTMARHINQGRYRKTQWIACLLDPTHVSEGDDQNPDGEHEQGEEEEHEDDEEEHIDDDGDADEPGDFGIADGALPSGNTMTGAMKRPSAAAVDTWFHGFDDASGKAWRQSTVGQGKREYVDVIEPDGATADSYPIAVFRDGSEVDIKNVTVGELRKKDHWKLMGRKGLWQGTAPDGEKLWVARMGAG